MVYDVVIVGGGPAGLTAGIYSVRAGKKVLIIEKMAVGGQVSWSSTVENYTGIKKIDGFSLAQLMFEHAKSLNIEFKYLEVIDFDFSNNIKKIFTDDGTFDAKSVILCLGASAKQLNLANEKKFLGRGVSYCATCDGHFFKGKTVAIVGGGNSSLEDAQYLSNLASKVYIIHRRDEFKGDKILVSKILKKSKDEISSLQILYNTVVTEIKGKEKLSSILVENKILKTQSELFVDALFIAIGRKPDTEMLEGKIDLDENGYILTNEKMETSISGVYAAGDVRQKQLRQIITACSDGAIASINTNDYIQKTFGG